MIPRKTALPWIVTLIAITLLTVTVGSMALFLEFRDAKWIVDSHPPLSYPMSWLKLLYPYIWILPFFATAFGVALLRKADVSAVRLSWLFCSISFALFCWLLLIFVAFFMLYCDYWHYD